MSMRRHQDCNTTKTPLWRGGPYGPKSLCNACGIRYRKKRREALGLEGPTKRRESAATAAACTDSAGGGDEEEDQQLQATRTKKSKRVVGREAVTVELRMMGLGKEVVLKQRRRRRRRRPPYSSWPSPPASSRPPESKQARKIEEKAASDETRGDRECKRSAAAAALPSWHA